MRFGLILNSRFNPIRYSCSLSPSLSLCRSLPSQRLDTNWKKQQVKNDLIFSVKETRLVFCSTSALLHFGESAILNLFPFSFMCTVKSKFMIHESFPARIFLRHFLLYFEFVYTRRGMMILFSNGRSENLFQSRLAFCDFKAQIQKSINFNRQSLRGRKSGREKTN